jgi:hypothetical protein
VGQVGYRGMVSESDVSLSIIMGVPQIFNELLTVAEVITGTVKCCITKRDNSLLRVLVCLKL